MFCVADNGFDYWKLLVWLAVLIDIAYYFVCNAICIIFNAHKFAFVERLNSFYKAKNIMFFGEHSMITSTKPRPLIINRSTSFVYMESI